MHGLVFKTEHSLYLWVHLYNFDPFRNPGSAPGGWMAIINNGYYYLDLSQTVEI